MERHPEEGNKTNELSGRELFASSLANILMAKEELFTGNTDALLFSSLIYQFVIRLRLLSKASFTAPSRASRKGSD